MKCSALCNSLSSVRSLFQALGAVTDKGLSLVTNACSHE